MAIKFPQLKKTPQTTTPPTVSLASPYAAPTANLDSFDDEGLGQYNNSKFYSAKGRIGRIRYLLYPMGFAMVANILLLIATFALGGVANLALAASGSVPSGIFMVIGLLALAIIPAMFYIVFAVAVRRLNDLNRTGWLSLLLIIPVLNLLLSLYLIFAPGTPGRNNYGLPAPPPTMLMKVITFIMLGLGIIGIIGAIASISAYQQYIEKAKAAQMQAQVAKNTASKPVPSVPPVTATTPAAPAPTNDSMPPATAAEGKNTEIDKPLMVEKPESTTNMPANAQGENNAVNFAQPTSDASQNTHKNTGGMSYEEFTKLSEGKIYQDPVRAKK